MRPQRGFTLLELIVALALSAIIVVAAMATFEMQNNTYTVVDQTTEVQQNMRAIADLIERDARSTAMGLPEEVAACGVDNQNAPDTIFVTDSNAIQPFDGAGNLAENQPVFAEINNPGGVVTNNNGQILQLDRIVLEQNIVPPPAAYGAADFQVNGGVIVANTDQPSQGSACGIITAVNVGPPASVTVDFLNPNALPWVAGEQLVAVPAHVYQIVLDANGVSVLQRNGTALASDVEDLQAVWFFDNNLDGIRDPGEMFGAAAPEPVFQSVGAVGLGDYRRLREMRINVVVRTRDNAPGSPDGAFIQAGMQAMENRVFVAVPNDGFLRRVHTTTVRLRNVGFRGRMGKKVGV